ncbi:MAG: hypothetical protein ABSB63_03810 [Spirochaetia bacterium]
MGLLRKAANASTRDAEGSIEASHSVSVPPDDRVSRIAASVSGRASRIAAAAPRMGLLRKSLALVADRVRGPLRVELAPAEPQSKDGARGKRPARAAAQEARKMRDPVLAAREIVAAIQALPDGVELPSQLFTELAARMSIEKGALLLFDPIRLVYAPWASQGYDQTTLHRMRIPLGANESFNALANGSPVFVEGASTLALYEQYFSAREFSSLSRILLTPFITAEKLIGVLLLTALKPPFEGDAPLLQYLKSIADAGSPRVQKAREKKLRKAGSQGMRAGASPEEEVGRYISSLGSAGTRILFLALSLEEYSRKIIAAHAHLDPFRLHEDLHYFLDSFVADVGLAIPIRQGLFIVALEGFDATDLDLFLHQLSSFLHGLFGGNGKSGAATGPQILKKSNWPEDGGDIRELLDFLSS